MTLRVIFHGIYHSFQINILLKFILLKTNHINKCPLIKKKTD